MYENQGVFKWLHDIMLFYTSRYKKEGVYCLAPKTGLEIPQCATFPTTALNLSSDNGTGYKSKNSQNSHERRKIGESLFTY